MSNCSCHKQRCKHTPMVHLHLHTDFSALDGASKSSEYVKQAKEFNHPAVTILDHGNMSGTLTHYNACRKAGIKAVLGMEAYLNDDMFKEKVVTDVDEENIDKSKSNTHQSIIIKDKTGYVNLNRLTYLSFTEGYFKRGRITTDWLFEHKQGLIVTSSCMASKFARLLEMGKQAEAEERIKLFMREFGEDFYAELQFNEVPGQKVYNNFILKMIKKYDLQPILTGDVHYAYPEDNKLQDVLIGINYKKPVGEAFALEARHLYYTNVEDFHRMNKDFGFNYPEHFVDKCLENTLKVAEKCNFEFEMDVEKYPKYQPTPDVIQAFKTDDTKEIITRLAKYKLKKKLEEYKKTGLVKITPEKERQYYDRLLYELDVIEQKKMLDYFLVVWELIRFCKENDISVGPGRGSAAGCLLSWCLDITEIDSLHFDLFFERFLNPTRKGPPDIDIDFEAGTDALTLGFLHKTYGENRVVPVVTFGTFNEKGCLKDVAKALGHDTGYESDVFAVTKEMPHVPKWDITLEDWFKTWPQDPACSDRVRNWITNPVNKDVIHFTLRLQKQVRNLGKHAAGIVITPGPVWELMPVNKCNGFVVSGFQESGNAKDVSSIGGLKLDRLKLETLNIIKDTLKYIRERHGEEVYEKASQDIKYVHYKHDDNLFIELRMGNNQGIFQFESEGMNSLLKGMRCETFDELVAANALYRPGPMGIKAHEEYIKNKFYPENRQYAHKSLKPLLENTNGVLIYQEQLMFIAAEIGGMSKGEGDSLRKAMDGGSKIILKKIEGKELTPDEEQNKNYKSYQELWAKFLEGAKRKGLSEKDVQAIESWLIKYLGYSFNLSHALSYSVLALRTLYLKHYFSTEFYCSLLNHSKSSSDKDKERQWMIGAIMAAMSKGLNIVPPNRKSNWEWTIIDDKTIAMGYSSINGLGEVAYNELKEKNIGKLSCDDFFKVKWKKFNKTSFENSVKAGLFDDWSKSREEVKSWRTVKIKDISQYDLFTGLAGMGNVKEINQKSKKFPTTTEEERQQQFMEVCNLDLQLLKNIAKLKQMFLEQTGVEIEPVTNFSDPKSFYYFSLLKVESRVSERTGTKFYTLTISDGVGSKKVNMWTNMYDRVKDVLTIGSFYISKFMKDNRGFIGFNASEPFRKIL